MYIASVVIVAGTLVSKFIESVTTEKYLGMAGWSVAIFALIYALNNVPVA